jgi:hypothetical protein
VIRTMGQGSLGTALIVVSVLVLLPCFSQAVLAETPPPGPTPGVTMESGTPAGVLPAPLATRVPEGAVLTRTPEPTATPGLIVDVVSQVAEARGLAG